MVATRHSLPADTSDTLDPDPPDTPPSSEGKRKLQNALKKLVIDGKDTLVGAAVEREKVRKTQTYHFRGATYEAIPGTQREWIEGQPERYKRKSSEIPANETPRKRQRRESGQVGGVAGKKRQREEEVHDDREEEEDEQPSAKRPRRNAEKYDISYARPRNIMDFTPSGRKSRKRQRRTPNSAEDGIDRMRTSRLHDYAVVGGHEALSCIEHAKRRAERRGLQVKPLPLPRGFKSEAERLARIEEGPRSLDMAATRDLKKLASLNSQIERGEEELREVKEACLRHPELRAKLAELYRGAGSKPTASAYDLNPNSNILPNGRDSTRSPTFAATVSPLRDEDMVIPQDWSKYNRSIPHTRPYDHPHEPKSLLQHRHLRQPSPAVSTTTSVEIITERHDSGASVTPPPGPPIHPTTTAATAPFPVAASLPAQAKDGASLRWSLPGKLTEVGRAEEAVITSRLKGESKAARRRRVKREFALVKRWRVEAAEEPDAQVGAEVEGAEQGYVGEEDGGVTLEMRDATQTPRSAAFVRTDVDADAAAEVLETPSPLPLNDNPGGSGGSGSSGERRSSRMEEKKSMLCKLWMKGSCWRGRRCTYAHGGEG